MENQQIVIYVQESDNLQKMLALKSSQGGRKEPKKKHKNKGKGKSEE